MYKPISIGQMRRARYAIAKASEVFNRRDFFEAGRASKQQRTILFRLECQVARRAAEELLKSLPSDDELARMVK